MAITYTSYVAQLANIMVIPSSDANFQTALPGIIDYAEGRCYRDLDLYATRITDTSASVSSGVNTFTLPNALGTFQVVERVNMLTSAGSPSSVAERNPCVVVSPDYINAVYGSAASSNCGLPGYVARTTDTQMLFGPAPDQPYGVEVYGTIRPTPLSSGNSSTWLTQWVPELFIAASMVFGAGYMRDFGSQSDDPRMSQSWETQYQALFKSAGTDELRKKYQSAGWTNALPSPIATPPRT